jgi:hypothetical protein
VAASDSASDNPEFVAGTVRYAMAGSPTTGGRGGPPRWSRKFILYARSSHFLCTKGTRLESHPGSVCAKLKGGFVTASEARAVCRAAEPGFRRQCQAVAVALHERTGWPLAFWYHPQEWMGFHVAVVRPDGRFVDIYGVRGWDELAAIYPGRDGRLVEEDELNGVDLDVAREIAPTILAAYGASSQPKDVV